MKYIGKIPNAQGLINFSNEENRTWRQLLENHLNIITDYACPEFIEGLGILNFSKETIPQPKEISRILNKATGWSVEPVKSVIPGDEFFNLLANKKFPVACFIRVPEKIDFVSEPDIFHEYFGHCPMLTNPAYADFMHYYGRIASAASARDRNLLSRLYFFTIEVGLVNTLKGVRVYGGGILSSKDETVYAIESSIPTRKPFSILETLKTPYRIDEKQKIYFVIDNFEALYNLINTNLDSIIKKIGNKEA